MQEMHIQSDDDLFFLLISLLFLVVEKQKGCLLDLMLGIQSCGYICPQFFGGTREDFVGAWQPSSGSEILLQQITVSCSVT